jgi:hypothetical protein
MGNEHGGIENKIIKWVNEIISKTKIGDFLEHYVTDRVMFDRLADIADKYEKECKNKYPKNTAHMVECMKHYEFVLGLIGEEK